MVKVKLDTKTIEVKKLPIGRYAELLKLIQVVAPKLTGLTTLDNKEIVGMIPQLLSENLPEVIKLISIGTDLPEDEIATFGVNEVMDLVVAIFTVNQYAEVFEKLKKGMARLPKNTVQPVTG